MASNYVKATTLRLAAIALNAVSALALLPFVLHSLGEYQFGLWGMATAISGYLLLLDFGIAQACTRYIALALEDKAAWVRTMSNALWMALFMSGVMLLAAIGLQVWLSIAAFDNRMLGDVVTILLVEVAFSLPLRLYQSIMRAEVDYTALGWHEITRIMLRVVGIPVLLWLGFGLYGIVIYSAIINSGFFALALFHVKQRYGRWFLSLESLDWRYALELLQFGKFALVSQVAEFFKYRVDSLLVGLLLGIQAVAGYAIMVVLIDMLAQIQMRLQSYWDTVIMRHIGQHDLKSATRVMLQSLQLGLAFTVVAMVNAYWFADVFLTLWVGEKYAALQPLLIVFIAVLAGSALQLATTPFFNALNRAKLNAGLSLAEVLLKLVLVVPLVWGFAEQGVVYATVIATLLVSVGFRLWYVAPLTQLSYGALLQQAFKPLLLLGAGLAPLVLVYQALLPSMPALWAKGVILGLEVVGLGAGWYYQKHLKAVKAGASKSRRPSWA